MVLPWAEPETSRKSEAKRKSVHILGWATTALRHTCSGATSPTSLLVQLSALAVSHTSDV